MDEQMEMFEDGGLMQEGGTVDEVSGNDVPPGALQEEVRDDIPAQLSEGEFVFPADVVRYFGLEKLMEMRQEAKAGLQRMEEMGQMGNSDEATLPDDLPFSLEDLDIEEEDEYNNEMEMAQGGVVKAQAGTFVQPQGFTPQFQPSFLAQYEQVQPVQPVFQAPQYKQGTVGGYVPQFLASATQAQQPTEQQQQPSFEQLIPAAGGQQETREYRNESGQSLFIPFVNGQPVYPIPEGYTEYKEEAVEEVTAPEETQEAVTTARVSNGDRDGLETTQVGGITGQQLKSTRDNLGVTGSRGIDLGALATGIGFIMNPVGAVLGMAAKKALGAEKEFSLGQMGAKDPTAELTPEQQAARAKAEVLTGQAFTGYVGNEIGDIDPVTGGQFGPNGVAIDTNTGFAAVTKDGQKSFNSVDSAKSFMGASLPEFMGGTGFYGGIPSADMFSRLSPQGKINNAKYLEQMEERLNTKFNPNTTVGAIKTFYGTAPADPVDRAAAFDALADAMANHAVQTDMTASKDPSVSANQVIGGVMAGVISPQKAMQEQGISVSDFSSATAAAQAGIGYSSYDENGQPTGAAPAGSGYSKTGTFSSGNKDTSTSESSFGGFSSQALGDKTSGKVGFDKGGLAKKSKPKKMKQGGLASKK